MHDGLLASLSISNESKGGKTKKLGRIIISPSYQLHRRHIVIPFFSKPRTKENRDFPRSAMPALITVIATSHASLLPLPLRPGHWPSSIETTKSRPSHLGELSCTSSYDVQNTPLTPGVCITQGYTANMYLFLIFLVIVVPSQFPASQILVRYLM